MNESMSQLLNKIKSQANLTNKEISKLVGVSTYTVKAWSYDRLGSPYYRNKLLELNRIIDSLPGTNPPEKRKSLLQLNTDGKSTYDRLRARHGSRDDDINA